MSDLDLYEEKESGELSDGGKGGICKAEPRPINLKPRKDTTGFFQVGQDFLIRTWQPVL